MRFSTRQASERRLLIVSQLLQLERLSSELEDQSLAPYPRDPCGVGKGLRAVAAIRFFVELPGSLGLRTCSVS